MVNYITQCTACGWGKRYSLDGGLTKCDKCDSRLHTTIYKKGIPPKPDGEATLHDGYAVTKGDWVFFGGTLALIKNVVKGKITELDCGRKKYTGPDMNDKCAFLNTRNMEIAAEKKQEKGFWLQQVGRGTRKFLKGTFMDGLVDPTKKVAKPKIALEFFNLMDRDGIGVIVRDTLLSLVADTIVMKEVTSHELYTQDWSHFDMTEEQIQNMVDELARMGFTANTD